MLRVVVLGAAAGGGVPQWNCGCPVCRQREAGSRTAEHPGLDRVQRRRRALVSGQRLTRPAPAVDRDAAASSRSGTSQAQPDRGVILTNGEIDALAGLLSMREGSPFTLYAHQRSFHSQIQQHLQCAQRKNVKRQPIEADKAFEPALPDGSPSEIEVLAFEVPGKGAWYLEGEAHPAGGAARAIRWGCGFWTGRAANTSISWRRARGVTDDLKSRLSGAALVFFDGTVWRDDELIAGGLGAKTGQGMGHISMSGDHGAIESLACLADIPKMFLHINNSNPALLHGSDERRIAEAAGWPIPADGTEITL